MFEILMFMIKTMIIKTKKQNATTNAVQNIYEMDGMFRECGFLNYTETTAYTACAPETTAYTLYTPGPLHG